MRELSINEIEQVNGGFLWSMPRIFMGALSAWRIANTTNWGTASYDDMRVAP